MVIYPAFFEDGEGGHVVVSFPDLPGCFTQGDDELQAMARASDALTGHLEVLREDGEEIPVPSALAALDAPSGVRVALVPSGPLEESPPVRINVSINKRLLQDVDAAARKEGMTRSGFLASAARAFLASLA
ncbi:MAG: type II toxin-antitoxin system HicB family antitoxin [Solidesulfovibrio sp. DCME]|uniref:type II toxin-antitoxin system HicB family antitoxin n=1 Tax=Solidesulfovibrio sp. DCME TaxID=3447380 RepID=UPI003D0F06B2